MLKIITKYKILISILFVGVVTTSGILIYFKINTKEMSQPNINDNDNYNYIENEIQDNNNSNTTITNNDKNNNVKPIDKNNNTNNSKDKPTNNKDQNNNNNNKNNNSNNITNNNTPQDDNSSNIANNETGKENNDSNNTLGNETNNDNENQTNTTKQEIINASFSSGCSDDDIFRTTYTPTNESIEFCQNDSYKKKQINESCPENTTFIYENNEHITCKYNVEKILVHEAYKNGYATIEGTYRNQYYVCLPPYGGTCGGNGATYRDLESCYCEAGMEVIWKEYEDCPSGYYDVSKNYFIYLYPIIEDNTCYKKVEWKYTCPNGYTLKDDKCYKN